MDLQTTAPVRRFGIEPRQVTIMFCDLGAFTCFSNRIDLEESREVIHSFQSTWAAVILIGEGSAPPSIGRRS
jgi:class 3 adenylate cyclase